MPENIYKNEQKIECDLEELGTIRIVYVRNVCDPCYQIWNSMVQEHHYIGHSHLFGEQIRYLVQSEKHGYIGALSYSSASWRLFDRDRWIGWNEENRKKHLNRIICNSRFLIMPHIRVKNLASHILGAGAEQVKKDWVDKYKNEPVLIETFVDITLYKGTSYKAANFEYIGETKGRGRNDIKHKNSETVKGIYMYVLDKKFKDILCAGQENSGEIEKACDWAEEEFGKVELGDKRLRDRLMIIARDFYGNTEGSIPQACKSRAKAKAAYRFFDNEEVKMDALLKSHYKSTHARMRDEKVILAIQDTTSLNYSTHAATEDLGQIGTLPNTMGLNVHDTMAFNVEGTPLGLINVQCWAINPKKYGKKHLRKELTIEEKESNKWLISFQSACEIQKVERKKTIVSIGDREADIYDLFKLALSDESNAKLLIRACQNRVVAGEQDLIWEHLRKVESAGTLQIHVPRKGNQKSRKAELTIRFKKVELKSPAAKKDKKNVTVWAITVQEEEYGAEVENPLKWFLLTTIPVNTFQEAVEKVEWYMKRWGIEIYHKTLKSGCKIENRQLAKADRLEACIAIDMVIAWRIYHLVKLGREVPNKPCTIFLEECEWKALVAYTKKDPIPPENPPTMNEAIRMIATMGGFLGRKSDGEPGVKTLWLGIQSLDVATDMWKVFNPSYPLSPP